MTHRLFVYGTLAPGRPNEHVLEGVPGGWQPATVRGELLQHGWGAEHGYPGIVMDEHGPEVDGFVLSSGNLDEHWKRLDEFEGDGYRRVPTVARLQDGSTVDVDVYVLRRRPEGPESGRSD
ncbi:MAG: gamma-glutamylcyclotransferase family protein [Marmoricola sp.]